MAYGRDGDEYRLEPQQVEHFKKFGYVHLEGLLSEEEMSALEAEYVRFLKGEVKVEGRDFCDMSHDYGQALEDYSIINIMLPSRYNASLKGSLYERRAQSVARQLCGDDMVLDYDQLLAKPPNKPDAVFHWHQDLAYWPVTPDTRTASFWLALDQTSVANGCVQFVPGTHLEPKLRHHGPLHGDRDKSHTLVATLQPEDKPKPMEIKRGDVTVHHERLLHGSGGNTSTEAWRRAWIIAFRSEATVAEERRRGFTHSHNDTLDVLNQVGKDS